MNRLWKVTEWLGKTTTYSYDDAGNLSDILNPNNTEVVFAYDNADRLTGLSNTKFDSTVISSYSYTLDAIGNHENVVVSEPLIPLISAANVAYNYDSENRMTGAGGITNTFDDNGNMTAKGNDIFAYDYNDRLVESTVSGIVAQYGYDGQSNRRVKSENGLVKRYVLDVNGSLSNVLAETDGNGTITAYYVHGLGLISKIMPDGTAYYYHYDSRGSAIALTDAGENITDAYTYDPFGNVVNQFGVTANPFRYVGRYGVQDEGNGLQYIRARYYIPEIGRFITKDPLTGKDGDSQSLNRYVYALNNPVRKFDISGLSTQEIERIENLNTTSDVKHEYIVASIDISSQVTWIIVKEGLSAFYKEAGIIFQGVLGILKLKKAADFADLENQISYIDNLYDTNPNAKEKINNGITNGKKWNELTSKQKEMELPTVTAVLGGGWTGKYIYKRAVEEGLYPVCVGCF